LNISRKKDKHNQAILLFMKRKNRLILALDVSSADKALSLARSLDDYFDAVKVGYPLILSAGIKIIRELSDFSPVIADLKIADIPNTNRLICQAALEAGAKGLIAHAFPGIDSLLACVEAASKYDAQVFAVTEMSHPGATDFMAPVAEKLARLAVDAGADGVVAPATRPDRIKLIRSIVGSKIIISPGVGVQGGSAKDAWDAGADYLIIGRSVTSSENPVASLKRLVSFPDQ
jgi:orotidine-5'-phosphate decarboxylase